MHGATHIKVICKLRWQKSVTMTSTRLSLTNDIKWMKVVKRFNGVIHELGFVIATSKGYKPTARKDNTVNGI